MTALSLLEPRKEADLVKEPAIEFADSADELHSRAGLKCCCYEFTLTTDCTGKTEV